MDNNNFITEEQRACVANSIAETFYQGELPYIFYRLIDKCLYEYGFDPRVVYQLFSMCYDKAIHRKLSLVEQLANSWYKQGYTKPEDLNGYILQDEKNEQICKLCGQLLRKRLNGLDIIRIEGWVKDYNISEPLVEYAFRQNEFRSNLTLKNIGDTLSKWHANGVQSLDEAVAFCEKEHQENKRKLQAKENRINIFSVTPLWHSSSDELPLRNGPYLVTQRIVVNDGEKTTVEKRWFRNGEWPLTKFEMDIGVKLEILSWALLPSPYIPQTKDDE